MLWHNGVDWLNQQRMKFAATLLSTTSLSIVQVSEQVGYLDANNFSTAFKREYKLSPRQYRKMRFQGEQS